MTRPSAQHASFVIERNFDSPPSQVFAAWATREGKSRWFVGPPGWTEQLREFDFRVGGRERVVGKLENGALTDFDAVYRDIVPDERIVYAYDMHHGGRKLSVSLATVEFAPAGKGTRMTLTEQGVFLDGYDDAGSRERGTGGLMDQLAEALQEKVKA